MKHLRKENISLYYEWILIIKDVYLSRYKNVKIRVMGFSFGHGFIKACEASPSRKDGQKCM